jgi:hypothetical protein
MNATFAFVLNAEQDWKLANEDAWDWNTIELDGSEEVLGHRKIEGAVFRIVKVEDKIAAVK